MRHRYQPGDAGNSRVFVAVGVGLALCLLLAITLSYSLLAGAGSLFGALGGSCAAEPQGASETAEEGIPEHYLELYQQAGEKYGIPWTVLAGIGRVETNHGRLDAQGVTSGENFAGAGGPMQFIGSTWERYAVDGNGDGIEDRYDPEDAVPAAAEYLKAAGAPEDMWDAIFAYNHADWYVEDVLSWAEKYAEGGAKAVRVGLNRACAAAGIPLPASGVVSKVIEFARNQLGEPYVWGAEGPNTFDCSGLTMMAYQEAGIDIPRLTYGQWEFGKKVPPGQEKPGDLVFFRPTPRGPGHVGLVIGDGKMIEAQQSGVPIKISSYEDRDPMGFRRPAPREDVPGATPSADESSETGLMPSPEPGSALGAGASSTPSAGSRTATAGAESGNGGP